MHSLEHQGIDFTAVTLDWFALEPHELCVSEQVLLAHTDHFKGALSDELADIYLKSHSLQPLLFIDSQIISDSSLTPHQETSHEWIARRILQSQFMNLCQGEMQHGNKMDLLKKSYQIAALLMVLWLVSLVLVNGIRLYSVNKKNQKIDAQIAQIYREFFPEAKQVISPQFRITQLLKNNLEEQNRFLFLLDQFATVMEHDKFTLEQVRYQNKILLVTLTSADFASLEQLEKALRNRQLKVKQTQASTHEQHVVATLELM